MTIIRQYLRKRYKMLRGLYWTKVAARPEMITPFDASRHFNTQMYKTDVSDRQSISPKKSLISASYHYASIELLILRHFFNTRRSFNGLSVLDIGCGGGHWIEFYNRLGAERIEGIDVSEAVHRHLTKVYDINPRIAIFHGMFQDYLAASEHAYDLINAISVMYHVVDDHAWRTGLQLIGRSLKPNGALIVSGHFGMIDNNNVKHSDAGVGQRLRSRKRWIGELHQQGFRQVTIHRNWAYLFIDDKLPESNLLVATK